MKAEPKFHQQRKYDLRHPPYVYNQTKSTPSSPPDRTSASAALSPLFYPVLSFLGSLPSSASCSSDTSLSYTSCALDEIPRSLQYVTDDTLTKEAMVKQTPVPILFLMLFFYFHYLHHTPFRSCAEPTPTPNLSLATFLFHLRIHTSIAVIYMRPPTAARHCQLLPSSISENIPEHKRMSTTIRYSVIDDARRGRPGLGSRSLSSQD